MREYPSLQVRNMNFVHQFHVGFKSYLQAVAFICKKGLWKYLLYPVAMTILLLYSGFKLAVHYASGIHAQLMELIHPSHFHTAWIEFFSSALYYTLLILLKIIFFFIFSSISKFIVLIVMSPVMSVLSEKTEELITGKKNPFNLILCIKNMLRGVVIAVRNLLIQCIIIIFCMLISWVPVLGWVSPVVLLVFSYYFYGFSMMDYVNERKGMGVTESVKAIRENRGIAIVNGFVFSMLFAVPFAGMIIAPVLAPVAAVIAMTDKMNTVNK